MNFLLCIQKCENDESIGKIREKDIIFLWKNIIKILIEL